MNTPLISVIVPIYMIERYLGLCIESIIKQTYKNLEIILVDDGSRDRCSEICDLYASKDKRIYVLHKPNGGLVSARKAGLQQAHGNFISYVDGDDWIEPNFIESLCYDAIKHRADMVCATFSKDIFSKSTLKPHVLKMGLYEGAELEQLWNVMISSGSYFQHGVTTYVWNKLFRKNILFPVQNRVDNRITLGEDAAVTYPALLSCKKVFITDNCDYHYRQREDSMLKQNTSYINDAQKLVYLYDYMMNWVNTIPNNSLNLRRQIIDYILSIAIIRAGGRLPHGDFCAFDKAYYGKNVVVYSAGTFGQQLINRFKEYEHCNVIAWVDDDFWEYRRCCLNVDSTETITSLNYDYILIATVDGNVASSIKNRLIETGIDGKKILTISVPDNNDNKDNSNNNNINNNNREQLLKNFLDVNALKTLGNKGAF